MPYHGSCFLFQFYIKPQLAMHGCMAMHGCFLFQFYIKPQQEMCEWAANGRCFLFQFYIKPQRLPWRIVFRWVVSYFNSTSNHNVISEYMLSPSLFLISILHQTTTELVEDHFFEGCFLFQFYIKPQLSRMKFF